MRKGFSLITAIIFIVLVATLGALALSLSTKTAKQTGDIYLREQAELLAQSATELALLAISSHDINATSCINQVNIPYPNFDINISVSYLGSGFPASCNTLSNTLQTADANRTVILDTVVTSSAGVATEPIRFHRRTLQKP